MIIPNDRAPQDKELAIEQLWRKMVDFATRISNIEDLYDVNSPISQLIDAMPKKARSAFNYVSPVTFDIDTNNLSISTAFGIWRKNGTSIYYNSGNVGMGTNNPDVSLHINAGSQTGGVLNDNATFLKIDITNDASSNFGGIVWVPSVRTGTNESFRIGMRRSGGKDWFDIFHDTNRRFTIDEDGNVGIGEAAPATALEIVGTITTTSIDTGTGNDLTIKLGDNAGVNFLRLRNSDDNDEVTIDSNGDITTDGGTFRSFKTPTPTTYATMGFDGFKVTDTGVDTTEILKGQITTTGNIIAGGTGKFNTTLSTWDSTGTTQSCVIEPVVATAINFKITSGTELFRFWQDVDLYEYDTSSWHDLEAGNLYSQGALEVSRAVTAAVFGVDDGNLLIYSGASQGCNIKLGDAAGGEYFKVLDSANAVVAQIDSDGLCQFGTPGTNYLSVAANGDTSFVGTSGFYPRRISQADIPAAGTGATQIDTGEILIWRDSDDGKIYLVYNDTTSGIKSVELA